MKTTYRVPGTPEISRNENLGDFKNSEELLGVLGFRASEIPAAQVGWQEKALMLHPINAACLRANDHSHVWRPSNPFRSTGHQAELTAKAS